MYKITLDDAAGETFRGFVESAAGWTVRVYPLDVYTAPFDAKLLGPDFSSWYDEVRVQRVDENGDPCDEPESIRVHTIHIY